jgi:hypothetical protein
MSQRTTDESAQKMSPFMHASAKPFAALADGPTESTGSGVKKVNTMIGVKRNYNAFCGAGELAWTLIEFNPERTLEKVTRAIQKERFETYVKRDFDTVDYDREELEQRMEEEIMKITLNFETYNPSIGNFLVGKRYRTITREDNEEGLFAKLERDLQKVAAQYGTTMEKVQEIFV